MEVRVNPFQKVAGPALRALASYDRQDVQLVYERDDVSTKERVVDDIHEELILNDIGIGRLEQLFGVGDWHCTMHHFEHAICIHHSTGDYKGVLVSIDTDASVDLEAVARKCDDV
ncbi:hypothetical protein PNP59_14375 [Halobacterium salinarum]|uniref:hypothetical protein n=1 Tax=Halobacterium salinarum TaxID=2242 RepID=UPI002557389A|nr:hypothetical protein [Halobacterium salinarum]MDL0130938.1 hypothetical protein [Halobacterium salinarum]MDL0132089.1 hypothetical protein [Halobacterium salinarum]